MVFTAVHTSYEVREWWDMIRDWDRTHRFQLQIQHVRFMFCINIYICMYICICICIYIYVYVHVLYIHIFISVSSMQTSSNGPGRSSSSSSHLWGPGREGKERRTCSWPSVKGMSSHSSAWRHWPGCWLSQIDHRSASHDSPCIYTSICSWMYVCMYVRTYVRMYVCMYVRMYVCMYACMHACMHVRTYVRMYIHIYLRIQILPKKVANPSENPWNHHPMTSNVLGPTWCDCDHPNFNHVAPGTPGQFDW